MSLRLVLLSDTHGLHRQISIPDGDVLIHAGDFCSEGEAVEARSFGEFFRSLPHRHKVVIAGNHDRCLEADPGLGREIFAGCHYLLDSGVEIGGMTFWGSPWQPWFFDMAFNLERGAELREKWDLIPAHVDVLITHGPPQFVLDRTETGENVGCEELRDATERTCPRLHVFGHIHHGHGWRRFGRTFHVNASNCAGYQEPLNPVLVVDLPADGDAVIATKVPQWKVEKKRSSVDPLRLWNAAPLPEGFDALSHESGALVKARYLSCHIVNGCGTKEYDGNLADITKD